MNDTACMVSILCTAFNHGPYIRGALDSFLMQETDFDYEILVSDDASSDATAEIIREYAARCPGRVRPFLMEENIFSRGRNVYDEFLFPAARGKYLALCEGDDYWTDPEKLRRQVEFLESHPDYAACVHNTVLHYCGGDRPDRPLLHGGQDRDLSMEEIVSGASRAFHTSSLMARAAILRDTQDFCRTAFRYGFTDYANNLWLRLNGPIRYLDRLMSVYRINSGANAWSKGVDFQYEKLRRFVVGQREMLCCFLPHAPEQYRAAVRQAILEREFELMYLEGRDREQRRPPYDAILKKKPFVYRAKNFVKCCLPALQRYHRRRRGFD